MNCSFGFNRSRSAALIALLSCAGNAVFAQQPGVDEQSTTPATTYPSSTSGESTYPTGIDGFEQPDGNLTDDSFANHSLPSSAPLTEVAAARPIEPVREAAPPRPDADGRYMAADLVKSSLLSGPGYTISPTVEVRGYMFHYTLQTEHGDIVAESNDLLPVRIEEISAIDRLYDTGLSEAAGKRAKQRSKQVWTSLKRVFTRPKETVSGLPQGVARMVKTRAKKIGRQVTRLYDRSRDELAEDDNAPEPTGPFTAARMPDPPRDPDDSRVERESRKAGKSLIKQELDFGSTRRFIAREVGVDPYSSNPVLKDRLDTLAWSATSSNVGYKLVMGALGGATAGILPNLLKIDRTVWEIAPEDLADNNRHRLNDLGCTRALTRRVVRNRAFSPTLQTELVNSLEKLRLPRGCDDVLSMAIEAEGEVEARFMVNSLYVLLAAPLPGRVGYGPGECEIEEIGGALGAHCLNELLVPVPVDALIWDADMALFLDAEDVRDARERTILVTGFADKEARRRLTDRGFAIIEHAPLN